MTPPWPVFNDSYLEPGADVCMDFELKDGLNSDSSLGSNGGSVWKVIPEQGVTWRNCEEVRTDVWAPAPSYGLRWVKDAGGAGGDRGLSALVPTWQHHGQLFQPTRIRSVIQET